MKKFSVFLFLILHCSHNEFQKPCEFTSEIFQKSILLTSILKLYDSYCNIRLNPSNSSTTNTIPPTTPVISNLVNNSSLQTGFMIGTSTGSATSIEVSLDNGAYQTAVGLSSWRFAFPTGSATWRDFSRHTISVRGRNGNLTSEPVTIRVTKLQNKDTNGDGFPDVVTSASAFNGDRGRVYIYHGGLNKTGTQSANVADRIITGSTASMNFGESLVLTDFNGDGFADLAVSCYNAPNSIYVFYSTGQNGISATQTTDISANRIISGESTQFGYVLTSGDINGDGYSDLISSDISAGTSGKTYILNGNSTGISQTNASGANRIIIGESTTYKLGDYVTTGDINGDGFVDLVIGVYNTASGSRVYIFHSTGASGITSTNASFASRIIIESANIEFGYSLATGDFNGDGFSDLIVGANDFTAPANGGSVFLYLSTGTAGISQTVSTSANLRINGENTSDRLGDYLCFGDLNNDGFAELIMGASRFPSNTSNGRVYIYPGSSTNPGNITINASTITRRLNGAGAGRYGAGMGLVDFNGDGFIDFANTANAITVSASFDGKFYMYYNNKASTYFTGSTDGTADWTLNGDSGIASRFGYNISQ